MVSRKPIVAIALVSVLLLGAVGPVAAHSWQTTVTQGPMELGVSSSPETPVAGMQAEFSARIADENPEGDEDRLDWGGVTNRTVEVHIRGPDGYHDHVTAEIPEDDAHFHWTYMFPTEGNYSIAVVTEIEGQEYAFQFQRNVALLPAKATGEEMEHLSEDVHAVNENVESVGEDVEATNEKVESLQTQVDDLESQVESLQTQIEDVESSSHNDEVENQESNSHEEENAAAALGPGFGVTAAFMAVAAIVAFVAGRRY
jgi:hypothetical protein